MYNISEVADLHAERGTSSRQKSQAIKQHFRGNEPQDFQDIQEIVSRQIAGVNQVLVSFESGRERSQTYQATRQLDP